VLAARGPALGVDLSTEAIASCRERYGAPAEFQVGDALEVDLPRGAFDAVVSVHTMEHVADDARFLARCAEWLAPGGRLVLEVPLHSRRPFVDVATPLSPDHEREYEVPALLALVGERFDVTATYGVARGAYLPLERARSAALIVGCVR
jgi:SAM-dependent methyltransferase